jgi:hypothetical protein
MASSIKGTTEEKLGETVKNVGNVLILAEEFGLQGEVIATAMIYLKENPGATIEEALQVGLQDWDI